MMPPMKPSAKERITAVYDQWNEINTESANDPPQTLTDEEAAALIKRLFEEHDGEELYPDDIANSLGLPVMQAIRVCEILTSEGKIDRRS